MKMSDEDPGKTWELSSNRGWERLQCKVAGDVHTAEEEAVFVEVLLCGRFWDRTCPHEQADLEIDYEVRLPQMCFSIARLRQLEKSLRAWLMLPLAEISLTPLEVRTSLCLEPQRLDLAFGELEGVSIDGHQGIMIHFETARLRGEVRFVTDQSCIRIFVEGLGSFLRTC